MHQVMIHLGRRLVLYIYESSNDRCTQIDTVKCIVFPELRKFWTELYHLDSRQNKQEEMQIGAQVTRGAVTGFNALSVLCDWAFTLWSCE